VFCNALSKKNTGQWRQSSNGWRFLLQAAVLWTRLGGSFGTGTTVVTSDDFGTAKIHTPAAKLVPLT
jgi:hypothetical protein